MAGGVSIRIEGTDQAAARARESSERGAQPRELWDAIGQMLITSTQHRFEDERGPDGNPWPKSIRVLVEGGNTLRDSGDLYRSISKELLANGVAVGTNKISAAIHQFGGTITAKTDAGLMFKIGGNFIRKHSVTIPARPFLGIDRDDEAEIAAMWEEWLGEPVGGIRVH